MRTSRNVFIFQRNSSSPVARGRVWLAALCGLLLTLTASPARAIAYQWTGRGDGRSWTDPNNWNGLLHLLCPGSLPCLDSVVIPDGTEVTVTASVNIHSITIGSGATLTVASGVVLGFREITGTGTLVNIGTVTPCGSLGTLGSGITLDDKGCALWSAGIGQTLEFGATATSLKGGMSVGLYGTIKLDANVCIYTTGDFSFPAGALLACDYIDHSTNSVFGFVSVSAHGSVWCY